MLHIFLIDHKASVLDQKQTKKCSTPLSTLGTSITSVISSFSDVLRGLVFGTKSPYSQKANEALLKTRVWKLVILELLSRHIM